MYKNWSKVVLVSMLIVVVAASMSFATTARVRSLANTGDYMSDDSNVNRWLNTLPSYANQVTAEVGQQSTVGGLNVDNSRGLSWNFSGGGSGTWRLTINENALDNPGFWIINPFYSVFSPGSVSLNDGGALVVATPINRWDIGWGMDFGETMTFGANFTRSSWNSERNDSLKNSDSWTTIGLGFGWSNNEDMSFDALFNIGMLGGELDGASAGKEEWDAGTAFDIAARMFWDWQEDITVPIKAEFISADYSRKNSNTAIAIPNGDKTNGFQIGAGVNIDVNQSNMFIAAIEWTRLKWEYSNPDTAAAGQFERTVNGLPTIRMALESSVTSWLTTRVGAARHQYQVTDKDGTNEVKNSDGVNTNHDFPLAGLPNNILNGQSEFEWFLGVGIDVAEWTIDMELADETPFSIGYWLTGYSSFPTGGLGPVARISAVYNY